MAWIKQNIIYLFVAFSLGCLVADTLNKVNLFYDELDCGNMKGYTTHVTYDHGNLVCVWRQNSWPFKTLSGFKV